MKRRRGGKERKRRDREVSRRTEGEERGEGELTFPILHPTNKELVSTFLPFFEAPQICYLCIIKSEKEREGKRERKRERKMEKKEGKEGNVGDST